MLFTRVRTPVNHLRKNVVPHGNLKTLVNNVLSALDEIQQEWHLRTKPHPIQDVAFLLSLIPDRSNVEVADEAPALLAATSDLAVDKYSSAVVATLAYGVQTIEYFFETAFSEQTPDGFSSFRTGRDEGAIERRVR